MTIAEAITQLQRLQNQHGDMPLLIWDGARIYEITDFTSMWRTKKNDVNQMEGHTRICFKGAATKIISYTRDGNVNRHAPYAAKFTGLIDAIAEAEQDGSEVMVIAEPWVMGDTHEEIIESLSRLAGTDIGLLVVNRQRAALNNQN